MSQRLIFPFTSGMILTGYKTAQYKKSWGYPHYGIDISSIQGGQATKDNMIRASGDGMVMWCRYDVPTGGAKSLGWAIAIKYDNCVSRDGTVKSLIVRYMHSQYYIDQYGAAHDGYYKDSTGRKVLGEKILAGRIVKAGEPIAMEGKVGTADYHVHFEMDTDTNYPEYTPQVSAGHSGWPQGRDSTVNPSLWLWQDSEHKTVPYNFSNKAWINVGIDDNLPFVPAETASSVAELKAKISALEATIKTKDARIAALESEVTILAEKVNKFRELAREASTL